MGIKKNRLLYLYKNIPIFTEKNMEQDKKAKALAKTTVLIDKAVVKEAKLLALETDQTVKQIVEDAIREKVRREKVKP